MQLKAGSAAVTNGSHVVTLAGANLRPGQVPIGALFKVRNIPGLYDIGAVDYQAQTLSLTAPYLGPSADPVQYLIVVDFTDNISLPEVHAGDIDAPDIITRALRAIDAAVGHEILITQAINIDGGTPFSVFGDTASINGGTP
jgi:hypothetical protein